MESIQLYIDNGTILRLEFLDAVHPTQVHQRAEHWNFIYQLYHNQALFNSGLFNNNYFIDAQQQLVIIEEYDSSILDKEAIEHDEDVIRNLRIFDFKNNKTGTFSKLTGHSFLLQRLDDTNFIFSKQYTDRTTEFEIDLASIMMVDFEEL